MWENTMLAGNEAAFWHFPGCHLGEDHQEMPLLAPVLLLPLITAPPGQERSVCCAQREVSLGIYFGKTLWSQKCKQPSKGKYNICNAGALGLLSVLCKGISFVAQVWAFSLRGIRVIWTLSLLSLPHQIPILQPLPVAAAGEAAGGRSTLVFCLPRRRTFLKTP